jgi:hypothetical protein
MPERPFVIGFEVLVQNYAGMATAPQSFASLSGKGGDPCRSARADRIPQHRRLVMFAGVQLLKIGDALLV